MTEWRVDDPQYFINREMKGTADLDNVEKEFKYSKEYMGLMKDKETVATEDFQNMKNTQEENVRQLLNKTDHKDVLVFTSGIVVCVGEPGTNRCGGSHLLGWI